eukprot:TRINITY_DN63002_c0_g1_i1.p1 TRINITY_DN63002_c0_g1~~TRINITY_DN63002_c0_g1_i1.p1  ORF type:complete len:1737 (-),score=221.68 TRINITY_DN63002_c0_g1_i1:9448-14529(-)
MATPAKQPHLTETASMILCWLRTAVPRILQNAGHPVTRRKKEQPVHALVSILQDAVVVADIVSYLDPMRIPPTAVMRSTGRGVMSSPLPVSSAQPVSNIDARQLHVQYKNNTRRVVDAVKKVLPDVRQHALVQQHPPAGAVDAFVGNVAEIPPSKDVWPAVRLAELVIACAVYGPRHNELRHSLWKFPTEIVRTTFHAAMASVASAVCLPPPEVLYKAGPPPSPAVMSPHALPPPMSHYSPQLSPLMRNPVSPGFSASPGQMLSPVYVATPQPINAAHTPPASTNPHIMSPAPYHGYSPRTPVHGPPFSPQQYATPQYAPMPVTIPPSHAATQVPRPEKKKSSRNSPGKPKPASSSSASHVHSPMRTTEGLVGIAQRSVPDAATSALEATALQISTDEGIGGRKLSLVTEDSGSRSREISPLPDFTGSFQKVKSRTDTSELDDFRNMSAVTEQGVVIGVTDSSKVQSPGNQASAAEGNGDSEMQSGKSSDDFFTPNESMSESGSHKQSTLSQEFFVTSSVPSRGAPQSSTFFSEAKVDEVVRQSVSTSVAEQISRPDVYTQNASSGSVDREGGSEDNARLNREPARGSSFDFTNPAFSLSPSFSDAPFPSNQWQVPRSKAMGHDILSPQTLFSPPQMPKRLVRGGTTGGHIAPRPAPKLFRSGTSSPHLSISSTGTRSNGDAERGSSSFSQRVAVDRFKNGAGPSRGVGSSSASGQLESVDRSQTTEPGLHIAGKSSASFSLPPSASESSERQPHGSVSNSPVPALVEDSQPPELFEDDDSFLGRDPMATPQSVLLEPLGEDDDISAIEETLSDRAIFQRVEEVLVRTSDYRASQDQLNADSVSNASASSSGLDSRRKRPGAPSDTRETRQGSRGSSAKQSPVSSPKIPIDIAGPSASRPPAGQTKSAKVRPSAGGSVASSTLATPEIKPSAALPPLGPDASSPAIRPSSRKPPMYSTPIMSTERRRGVPPTPPSPPSIETLIKKFSDQTPPSEPVEYGNRPISTMEPSDGLFQKLISVWQSSDEDSRDQGSVRSNILDGGLTPRSAMLQPSGSGSHESTLPSGDTELALGRSSTSIDSSRSRRPRAVRLPDKSLQVVSESMLSPDEEIHSKLQELHEGASMSSYGDMFPGEKDRALKGNQVDEQRNEKAGISRGDTSLRTSSGDAAAVNTVSTTGGDSESSRQRIARVQNSGAESSQLQSGKTAIDTDGHHVRVDKRRLDWLTRELLAARDAISRKELQMTFAETQRLEQQEILLLEKQDAESVVEAMKRILAEREQELKEARHRLSTTIQNVSTQDRSSLASKTSMGGADEGLGQLIREGHEKLHMRIQEAESKQQQSATLITSEMQSLWSEVQKAMIEKMMEMTEKRDMELETLRKELESREKQVKDLQSTSSQLVERNRECEAEASEMRLETLKATHRYELEMSHVTAQVELVNEFSKKLHDNFRETENLRQQVLHYQDKLSHITNTTGVSQRQIKELREAVTRANDECARLRREADLAKKKGWEAIRRAEELEDLRIKDEAAQVAGRYPERHEGSESGSYRSHERARSPRTRAGGVGGRYHGMTRTRGVGSPTPAQKAWLVIKDKIGGIVANKDMGASRRRGHPYTARRDPSRTGTVSQTSQTRSRNSNRDDDVISRSTRSRSSNGSGGTPRANMRRMSPSPSAGSNPYMHSSPHSRGEGQSVRAAGF